MCKKKHYKSFAEAFSSMQRLNKIGYDIKRAYECPYCGDWHNTSMSLSQFVRRKR